MTVSRVPTSRRSRDADEHIRRLSYRGHIDFTLDFTSTLSVLILHASFSLSPTGYGRRRFPMSTGAFQHAADAS